MRCAASFIAGFTASLLSFFPVIHAATIDVIVGGPGTIKFTPEFINANIGDVVQFTFQQKNHTATQSTFSSPCSKAQNGFDSEFIPVSDNQINGFPVARFTVTELSPVWVYCRQATHCQQGMVFAINPGDRFAAFKATAMGLNSTSTDSSSISPIANSATTSAIPSASTSIVATDHKVIVGGPGILAYRPSNITAQVGDTITFEFHEKNHTVTASSFATPCRSLSSTSLGNVGFDSGFMPVADGATIFPTFTIRVNDTNPIWAYCQQATHCGQGMVFSVNAVESGSKNFSAFEALAKQLNGTGSANQSNSAGGMKGIYHCAGTMATILGIVFGATLLL